MGRKKVRIPPARRVHFELRDYRRLFLRKTSQLPTTGGELVPVDMSIEMSLREWDKLVKAIRKQRSASKERKARSMQTIKRPGTVSPFVP